jgi:hypothetical protein
MITTLPSSTRLRLQCLTRRIYALGEAPIYHLLAECVAMSSGAFDRIEAYAALPAEFIAVNGGRDLPPNLWRIK